MLRSPSFSSSSFSARRTVGTYVRPLREEKGRYPRLASTRGGYCSKVVIMDEAEVVRRWRRLWRRDDEGGVENGGLDG